MKTAREIDIDALLTNITCWDDWYRLEQEIFRLNDWPLLDDKKVEQMLEREPIVSDGTAWVATSGNYAVERELEFKYEKLRNLVFVKLEPDAAKENSSHPERYGTLCIFCSRWTKNNTIHNCGICGNELLPFPLNEE